MFTNFKHSLLTAGTFSLLSFGTFAVANPANAASLDLTTWQKIGDVTTTPSQAILKSGTGNTVVNDGGAGSISTFLGVSPAQLDNLAPSSIFGATQGSAIKNTFNANVGDILSFNWNFSTTDTDSAFVTINGAVTALTGSSPFSYTFNTAGSYLFGIGLVDVDDAVGVSQLLVSNAQFNNSAQVQPVPEPATMLGSLTALGFGAGMLKRFRKKEQV
ncbi:PEP-CTERM sorting domain-containing protein [Calothrix sp. PCC 7507]|uniref:PEP-CTERM sorting domain-containing protein n=1 Tax=Calothrix sp. PCC 7507 TaxID=99598 RepID=UPI00029ECC24|nr:PEP-CTERM sorting domain-containing protein [Calothrix sp. PCC 7507]AFY32950.1 PEP motif putative anchor domain protein [Calothrix sp. PCC 7507]